MANERTEGTQPQAAAAVPPARGDVARLPVSAVKQIVVIGQNPAAGQQVPAGTAVDLILHDPNVVSATLMETGGLQALTLGTLRAMVEKDPAVKQLLVETQSFEALSEEGKAKVTRLLADQPGVDPGKAFPVLRLAATL